MAVVEGKKWALPRRTGRGEAHFRNQGPLRYGAQYQLWEDPALPVAVSYGFDLAAQVYQEKTTLADATHRVSGDCVQTGAISLRIFRTRLDIGDLRLRVVAPRAALSDTRMAVLGQSGVSARRAFDFGLAHRVARSLAILPDGSLRVWVRASWPSDARLRVVALIHASGDASARIRSGIGIHASTVQRVHHPWAHQSDTLHRVGLSASLPVDTHAIIIAILRDETHIIQT